MNVEQVMGKSWASHRQENGAEQVAGLPDRVMQQQWPDITCGFSLTQALSCGLCITNPILLSNAPGSH